MYRILYIDDEPSLLEIAKLFLERSNDFSVDIDTSAEHALHTIGTQTYHAIVSDFQMPDMDGIDLLKAVRGNHGNIPFILFTGRGREEVVIEAINNGVDFYLQKGGDPKAQFAELEHKIRQAIARRQAENSLNESEKRLADIINFLPDATFAIDRSGQVIAWNHAIEEMTGVPAADILGKGEYEYAIPFYGKRRPILIDLIFKPEEDISKYYKGISREKDVLIAETDLPQPKGVQRTLMGKASPLYSQKGEIIGAIESIRDITRMKETELSLQEQNKVLASMNQFSLELALLPAGANLGTFIVRKLMELTGGVAAWYSDYHPADRTLIISHLESGHDFLEKAVKILGKDPHEIKTVISADEYMEIVGSSVKKLPTLTDVSFGQIPPAISFAIQKVLGIDHFFGLVYVIEGELYATSVLAIGKGKPDPSVGFLESFSHMVAVSLRRRSAEEKLCAGEEKFRTVADFTYGWEYWEAPDHSIIYMSPSCERISGYSREEFQQNPSLHDSIVDPRDREVWENHRKEADETKTALSLDFRIVRKDGEVRWINHTCHPVFDSAGRHLGRRASNRDITEKKRMDDELRAAYEQLSASQEELQGQFEEIILSGKQIQESEEKLRTFMEASIDGVLLIEADGTILAWNPSAEQIFGIPASEALKSNIVDLQIRLIVPEHQNPAYIEDLRSQFTTSFPKLFSRKTPLILEVEVMNTRGRRMTVQQALFPIQTTVGKRIGCIVREVTEQRNAEKNLMESEARFRDLADLLPQMVFEMAIDFRVTYANQIALTTMGVSDKDLEAGVSALSFIDPSDHERIRQNIEKIFRGETVANPEYTAVRRDGSTFPVMIYAAPISRSGKPAGLRGILIDITGQKQTENALRESELFLKETQKIARLGGWKANPHTDYLEWTDGIYDIIEAPRSYHPGLTEGMKYYAPEDILGIREKVAACLSTGEPFAMEALIITETGKQVWTELRGLAPVIEGIRSYVIGTLQDITGRKLVEDALRESEERFKTLFEKSAEAQLLLDSTGMVSECNAAFLTLFALQDNQEILGHSPDDFAPEFQPDGVLSSERGDEIMATVAKDGMVRYEWAHLKHDPARTAILTDVICTLIQIAGQPMIHVSIRDITDRKNAEDALREQEATLSSILRAAPVGIGMVSNRVLMRVNDRLCEMTGYSAGELVGKSARIIYPDDEEFERVGREKYELIRKFGTGTIETRWRRKDGEIRDVLLSSTPLDPENHIAGVTFTALDITDRKRVESELRIAYEQIAATEEELRGQYEELAGIQDELLSQKQQLEEIAGTVPGVIYQFYARPDGSMGVYYVSSRAGEMLGYDDRTQDFFVWFTKGVDPLDRDAFFQSVNEVVKAGQPWNFEGRFIKPSGEKIWFQGISRPVARQGELVYSGVLLDITQRKLAEEALQESEQNYRGVIENLQDVFYRADAAGNITMASPSASDVFGYSSVDEVIGLNLARDFYTDPKNRRDFLTAIQKTGSVKNFEAILKKKDGSPVIVSTSAHYYHDPDGNVLGVEGIAKDITEWKHAEEGLRESEAKFRAIIDQSFQFVGLMTTDGILIEANQAALKFAGISESAVINRPFWEAPWWSHSADLQELLKDAIQRAASGETIRFEATHPAANGHFTYIDFSIKPMVDPTGRILYLIPEGRDLTERKEAEEKLFTAYGQLSATEEELRQQYEELAQNEEKLRLSEEKFRTLVETTSDFIWEVDESGTYSYVSPQVREMLGYEPEELIGKTPFDFMQPDEALRVAAEFTRFVDSRLPISSLENSCIHKNGSIVVLETCGVPRLAKDRSFTGYRGIDRDITMRKHAEEALKESEEKYRTILDTTSEWIWDLGLDGRHTYSNNGVESLLGYTVDEFLGFYAFDLMHPEDKKQGEKIFTTSIKERKGWRNLVTRWQHKDGTYRYLESNATTIVNERGELTGFRGADRDITDRKLAEEAIRNSEAALREKSAMLEALFNAIPDVIGVQDLHHGIIRYNAAGYAMVGKNPGEVTGKRCYELIGHDAPCEICATSETYRSKKPAMVQKFVPEIDAWLDVRSYPVLDDTGEIRFIIEHLRDISNQKRAEESIREKTEEINQYFSTSLDLFCIADTDGYFRRLNPEWEKTLGYTLAELEGKRILDLVHPDDLQATLAAVATLRSDKEVLNFTNRYCHKDGTYRWLEWRSILLGDRIYAAARDITERRNMENAVREVNRKLNLLNSVTRHDVANQIMVLRGYTQIAEMENPGPGIAGLLARIDASSLAIARLIEFTRMYQELGIHTPAWFRLDEIIATTGKTVVLLSGTCNQVEIFADPLLERVFFNLFDNADRHGERVTEVTIRCEPVQERLVIIVEDNGVGIPSEEKEKIFGRGYGKNTGLGLFLAREILAITGITISETGVPGKGARFEIAVPDGAYRFTKDNTTR